MYPQILLATLLCCVLGWGTLKSSSGQLLRHPVSAGSSCMSKSITEFSKQMKDGFKKRIEEATRESHKGPQMAEKLNAAFAKLHDNFQKSTDNFTLEYMACKDKKWIQKNACYLGVAGVVIAHIGRDIGAWIIRDLPSVVTSATNNFAEGAVIAGNLGVKLISLTAKSTWKLTLDLKNCF